MIPLILKLKKSSQKEIAKAQDLIVEEIYKVFDKAIIHGGTTIWRCYNGNRFSEDIDAYIPKEISKIDTLFESLGKKGFRILKKKVGKNSIYSNLELNRTIVRFEAIFKTINGVLKEYQTSEGNLITVYTLTPEELIKEKVNAYTKRFKIRDLYDIFFLLRYVKNKDSIKKELNLLISNFKQPADKKELKVLIIEGLTPDVDKMLQYIKTFGS